MSKDIQRARQLHIADIIGRSAKRHGDKIALIDGETKISFKDLDRLVSKITAHLYAAGLRKGDKLVLMSHNCWQFPAILHAAARLGVIGVPINFMLNANEVNYLLEHSQPKMIVVEDELCHVIDEATRKLTFPQPQKIVLNLNEVHVTSVWQNFEYFLKGISVDVPEIELNTHDPIRMMYTSGTESLPKGVLLNSESLILQYTTCIIEGEMSANDKEIHAFPLYHCAQLDAFLNVDLFLGATSYIFRRFDPELVLRTIAQEKITKLFCPPTAWIALLNNDVISQVDLGSLAKAYYGASTMPRTVIEQLRQLLPHIRFWQFYGQTEMAPVASVLSPDDHEHFIESVGKPALHVQTEIMDENGTILPVGHIGEIVHRSCHLTLGYDQNIEKTNESFSNGWFHSGDLGYFNEHGYLYVVDRIKDMVKTGGENVSTREVEEVIYTLEGIKEVAVIGLPHDHWIEEVVAVIIKHDHAELDENKILQHCRTRLSSYKAPKKVFFRTELPKNASGKILKRELKNYYKNMQNAIA